MLREDSHDVAVCAASVVVNYASVAVLLGSVSSFACFHVFISARNVTTIEFMDHLNGRGIFDHFRTNVSATKRITRLACFCNIFIILMQCYDMGWRQNLKQVREKHVYPLSRRTFDDVMQLLGQRTWTWLLPFYPWILHAEGDGGGLNFPNKYNSTVVEYHRILPMNVNADDSL